jgi:hypothetical protein
MAALNLMLHHPAADARRTTLCLRFCGYRYQSNYPGSGGPDA